jgi:hypothetical protein
MKGGAKVRARLAVRCQATVRCCSWKTRRARLFCACIDTRGDHHFRLLSSRTLAIPACSWLAARRTRS